MSKSGRREKILSVIDGVWRSAEQISFLLDNKITRSEVAQNCRILRGAGKIQTKSVLRVFDGLLRGSRRINLYRIPTGSSTEVIIASRKYRQITSNLMLRITFHCGKCCKDVEPDKLLIGKAHVYALHCEVQQEIGLVI